jgi:hypothetical protein
MPAISSARDKARIDNIVANVLIMKYNEKICQNIYDFVEMR